MSGERVDMPMPADATPAAPQAEAQTEAAAPAPPPARDPALAEADFGAWHALDPRFLVTERIASVITSGVLALGGLVVLLLELVLGWWGAPGRAAAWGAFVVILALLAWLSLVWPKIALRAVAYRHGRAGMEIRRGVWWRRVITIPAARIQHTDVTQGPLLRRFGLATLTVHTAATRTPSILLSGLAHPDALRVRDALTRENGGEGV